MIVFLSTVIVGLIVIMIREAISYENLRRERDDLKYTLCEYYCYLERREKNEIEDKDLLHGARFLYQQRMHRF